MYFEGVEFFPERIPKFIPAKEQFPCWLLRPELRCRMLFLFAPGAGAPSSHPWMQRWKKHLEEVGDVETFDYPYMRQNRKRPDPLPQLIAAHRQALAEALAKTGATAPIILIGKSMGGRIGCHVALEEKVDGLICL